MPGFYDMGKYDIAGFSVGIVDRAKIVDGSKIREGDALLGLCSSGPHSSGFSLIRKVITDLNEDFGGIPIGRALLEPTRLYAKPVLSLMEKIEIHGMAHITGGGFYENIPRIFIEKQKYTAVIREGSWDIPPIFARLAAGCYNSRCSGPLAQRQGLELLKVDAALKKQMFNTFNMGIGFVLALAPDDLTAAKEHLENYGFPSREIGYVEKADGNNAQELRI